MKTSVNVVRTTVVAAVITGLCLTQGCSTVSGWFGSGTAEPAKPDEKGLQGKGQLPPPPPSPPVFKVEPRPVEPPKLKLVAPVFTSYTVKAGESVSDVAYKYRLRWQDVLAANPELSLKSHLRTGQVVHLPGQVDLSKARTVPKKVAPKKKPVVTPPPAAVPGTIAEPVVSDSGAVAPAAGEATYAVQSGDSVFTIAAKHHVKRVDLMKANALTDKSKLKIGQKLVIPAAANAAQTVMPAGGIAPPTAIPETGTSVPPPVVTPGVPSAPAATEGKMQSYTVKEGEDLYAVAIRWGVSPTELKAVNNLTTADLAPGTVLKIPVVQTTP